MDAIVRTRQGVVQGNMGQGVAAFTDQNGERVSYGTGQAVKVSAADAKTLIDAGYAAKA